MPAGVHSAPDTSVVAATTEDRRSARNTTRRQRCWRLHRNGPSTRRTTVARLHWNGASSSDTTTR